VGDVGLMAIRAILECGVGYVVTGWTEPDNPLDEAIDAARAGIFERRGVLLRRLRHYERVAETVANPGRSATAHEGPMRGLVIWNGVRGVRPALERFCTIRVPGPVVGLCFDEEAASAADLPLVDPEPTPQGVVGAIHRAFALSAATGQPALVLLRPAAVAMRGVLRCSQLLTPASAHAVDAEVPRCESLAQAIDVLGLTSCAPAQELRAPGVLACCSTPVRRSLEGALARAAALLVAHGAAMTAAALRDACIAELALPAVPGELLARTASAADTVLCVEPPGIRLAAAVAAVAGDARIERVRVGQSLPPERELAAALLEALTRIPAYAEEAAGVSGALTEAAVRPLLAGADPERLAERLVRRAAVLQRTLPPPVAAGLVLAQAAIGVPSRIDDAFPSYRTDGGGTLTVVTADQFAEAGIACAAPAAQRGRVRGGW
jgi:hypothetical protein